MNKITNDAMTKLYTVMLDQDDKGMEKYGEPLNPTQSYDWDRMADEELADYLKYRECARQEKDRAIALIEQGLKQDNLTMIKEALQILQKGATT